MPIKVKSIEVKTGDKVEARYDPERTALIRISLGQGITSVGQALFAAYMKEDIPRDAVIVDMWVDRKTNAAEICLSSPSFDVVSAGMERPHIRIE